MSHEENSKYSKLIILTSIFWSITTCNIFYQTRRWLKSQKVDDFRNMNPMVKFSVEHGINIEITQHILTVRYDTKYCDQWSCDESIVRYCWYLHSIVMYCQNINNRGNKSLCMHPVTHLYPFNHVLSPSLPHKSWHPIIFNKIFHLRFIIEHR